MNEKKVKPSKTNLENQIKLIFKFKYDLTYNYFYWRRVSQIIVSIQVQIGKIRCLC